MNAMNPAWDPRWSAFGGRPFGGPRAAFRAAMAGGHHDDEHEARHGRGGRRHGGPRFGPGFGPGFPPPFGPRGFGGPRGRRGRRTSRGDVRAAVLALVAEQPRHGYEIIQEITERSGGAWRPSPGSVYPTLSQLEDEGLVRVEQTEGRRVVHLTEEGTRYVAEHREELDKVWESVRRDADEDTGELWDQLSQLHAAAMQVMATGTPEQIETATATITEARKSIYRLLAE
ncbi:PadR family transcriptional regulator [Pseudonocardia acidicola]|uniref:PadR family transcriptional regulator n=1 Tax=Pseudonocardia acidicola TaxID=2724939 RepID=A0ABX1S4V2_9PSEU|nr:PadR family transcriptional regulator [Pseudonocardia acidicola]NMH95782.1 PadR family transcriptional regulator [Pseudonocardia acidicola]